VRRCLLAAPQSQPETHCRARAIYRELASPIAADAGVRGGALKTCASSRRTGRVDRTCAPEPGGDSRRFRFSDPPKPVREVD